MQRNDVPWNRLAELYGVVVTPEEARRFYRRQAWMRVAIIWGITLVFLIPMLILKFTGAS